MIEGKKISDLYPATPIFRQSKLPGDREKRVEIFIRPEKIR